jgi:hypothetical protein
VILFSGIEARNLLPSLRPGGLSFLPLPCRAVHPAKPPRGLPPKPEPMAPLATREIPEGTFFCHSEPGEPLTMRPVGNHGKFSPGVAQRTSSK